MNNNYVIIYLTNYGNFFNVKFFFKQFICCWNINTCEVAWTYLLADTSFGLGTLNLSQELIWVLWEVDAITDLELWEPYGG